MTKPETERLRAAMPAYADAREAGAYVTGWRHGREGRTPWQTTRWPDAYKDGYWAGFADRDEFKR